MSEGNWDSTPAIVGKASSKKKYYFTNKFNEGIDVNCFVGDAPRKGCAPTEDTCRTYNLKDNGVVELPERVAEELRKKGMNKPIYEENEYGERRDSGRTRFVNRYQLDEIR